MENTSRVDQLSFLPKIDSYLREVFECVGEIDGSRMEIIDNVASEIQKYKTIAGRVSLIFICTHNSRRSHFAQIWGSIATVIFGIDDITCYSGGTEETAFHPNAIAAIQRAGFITGQQDGRNPVVYVRYSDEADPIKCFSKKFDSPSNPDKDFIAIMTCSDAEENCPYIPGAHRRISLTYEDPKISDGSVLESETYDARCKQIATELMYLFSNIHYGQENKT